MKKFKKVLVANRGEIAIRIIRACQELGIVSVAIYAQEDRMSLFRTKADEAYLITGTTGPIEAYLNMDKIIALAKQKECDAIHPGYGFLSENPEFAKRCERAGIVFIGPTAEMMHQMGDKIQSKIVAQAVNVPVIPGIDRPIASDQEAVDFAEKAGYPIMLKAAAGGGGRGMRIVRDKKNLLKEYHSALSEATKAFGDGTIFVEKYLEAPRHIEVQILGDNYGNVVHLFERDCSIQRRHQKVIEFTPSLSITEAQRQAICEDAIKLAKNVNYRNAGTIEFLVNENGEHYFIEMNPRIQVEHTITELVTGIDIVQAQIKIAEGCALDSEEIGIASQASVSTRGSAIQCRITTEDPKNHFLPDTGRLDVYRSAGGCGIRLDGGNSFTGSEITPYYDSLLVKSSAYGRNFEDTRRKALRAMKEITVEGVQTNKDFLINVLQHPDFKNGNCDTRFIDKHPELLNVEQEQSPAYNIIKYFGKKAVNENFGERKEYPIPKVPSPLPEIGFGSKQILDTKGPDGLVHWINQQKKLLLGDTTMRDAHQSLTATRIRTRDLLQIAPATAALGKDLFALEMWGGATFDVAYNFLKESPWRRLELLREAIPNVLFQMLIRGANAVGYKNYPDNLVRSFIQESAKSGIDVFRVFDSLNWMENMKPAIDTVLETGKVAEVAMCYTGDILDPSKTKYDLDYYVDLAHQIEGTGAHILAIKDMSGLVKPAAAYKLVKTLKEEVHIPVRFHTHDTTGNAVASVLMASRGGADICDAALSSMSGLTSQPSLNAVVAALKFTTRDTEIDEESIQLLSDYWSDVRPVYTPFESGLKSTSTEIYKMEIPGGQYSNLASQVESFGLGHRFEDVKKAYVEANLILGNIIKVTPSSKVVGDLAIFMVQNDLNKDNIYTEGANLDYPNSVIDFFAGMIGQPVGGFNERLRKIVLKGKKPITVRPGSLLEPVDFEAIKASYRESNHIELSFQEQLSAALYPKVFKNYIDFYQEEGDFTNLESHAFFYGLGIGETCEVELAKGRHMIIQLISIGQANEEGYVPVLFEVDGFRREIYIEDTRTLSSKEKSTMLKVDKDNANQIGASIPGMVMKVLVNEGDTITEKQPVIILEAMKMETEVLARKAGTVGKIYVTEGQNVQPGELMMEIQ